MPSLPAPENLKFEREDWSLFRTVEGLQQKAGVPEGKLRRLVLKELADNGLDTGAEVRVGEVSPSRWFVEDDGPGIDGTPEEIAKLFSIARPLVSSKLLRLPTRGTLGNGLRVTTGAVLASGGSLSITTRNRRIVLRPERDGGTAVVSVTAVEHPGGTRIEIGFGPALPPDSNVLSWAEMAVNLAKPGTSYQGKSSPWWYDVPQFHELLYASDSTVRELISSLDGCTGAKAGEIVAAAGLGRALCKEVTLPQATKLLTAARKSARPVNPERLGSVGYAAFPSNACACVYGNARFGAGEPYAEIPFVAEAWACEGWKSTHLSTFVNRTPITASISAAREKRDIEVYGCGLFHIVAQAPKEVQFDIQLNITAPYIPITSDGKAPDLEPFFKEIHAAIEKAVEKAHRQDATSRLTQKDVVLDNLDTVIEAVSGGGEYRFNQRQLLYGLRPIVKNMTGRDLLLGNFTAIITDYENENGEIPLMYREPRGTITHPHRDETITLGTLMVEEYQRPLWTFNKLLYIEKEGFAEALKAVRWGERHDTAMLSSKGFSTRAARDLIDLLAAHDEPVEVFCVHDADAPGSMIYQTLQEATRARRARKIQIVNLGLEPWEALHAGLEVEDVKQGERLKPVADYVLRQPGNWDEWLQNHRVELNAMTTPQFIDWLDHKMAVHARTSKLIPPADVLAEELDQRIETKLRANLTERILREAGLEAQVKAAAAAIKKPDAAALAKGIKQLFKRLPDRHWRDHIEAEAAERTK